MGTPEGGKSAPADSPAQQVPAPALPAAAQPVLIRYASAALDVPVHALELDGAAQASQTIVPPVTKDGYWLTRLAHPGTPPPTRRTSSATAGKAKRRRSQLSSAATVGDRFELDTITGTITYKVDSVTTYLKSGLKDSPIWDIVPNRLVLISCYTEDPWGKNVVVTASPAIP